MKLLHKEIEKNGSGKLKLCAENIEDTWHIYNLVQVGDSIKASTIRKVQSESATGSTSSQKIRTTLKLVVETIDYDQMVGSLRVKGRNCEENQFVKMGAYHTIDLELHRVFILEKDHWDTVSIDRIDMACDINQNADVAAIIMQNGLAYICLVTPSMTLTKAKIDVNIPRKRKMNCGSHQKALNKFYNTLIQSMLRHINFNVVKCILIASPGFVKDEFFKYMMEEAIRLDQKKILNNKSIFMLAHSSTGFKHSLSEVLREPAVLNRLKDTKALSESKSLVQFFDMMKMDPDRTCYGINEVIRAITFHSVDILLICDYLFRSIDFKERAKYVKIVDDVKEYAGTVKVMSSLHITGEQLKKLTGIAAILRFPVAEENSDDSD